MPLRFEGQALLGGRQQLELTFYTDSSSFFINSICERWCLTWQDHHRHTTFRQALSHACAMCCDENSNSNMCRCKLGVCRTSLTPPARHGSNITTVVDKEFAVHCDGMLAVARHAGAGGRGKERGNAAAVLHSPDRLPCPQRAASFPGSATRSPQSCTPAHKPAHVIPTPAGSLLLHALAHRQQQFSNKATKA